MKIKKKGSPESIASRDASKPRNEHLNSVLMSMKCGAHQKSYKSKRRQDAVALAKMVKEAVYQSHQILVSRFFVASNI